MYYIIITTYVGIFKRINFFKWTIYKRIDFNIIFKYKIEHKKYVIDAFEEIYFEKRNI